MCITAHILYTNSQSLTAAPAVTECANAAILPVAHQACVLSIEVVGQILGPQQPPYNHSMHQRSASGERRGYHHREIPGIINKHRHTGLSATSFTDTDQ